MREKAWNAVKSMRRYDAGRTAQRKADLARSRAEREAYEKSK